MSYRVSDRPMLAPPVRPLVREGYVRLPAVEAELTALVALPTRTAQEGPLATYPDTAPGGTHAESVAYFVRECHRAEDTRAGDWLTARLLERCDGFLAHHLRGLTNESDREDARAEVISAMFREMDALDRTGGEYYQVRFWNVLKLRCTSTYTKYANRAKQERRYRAHLTRGAEGDLLDPLDRVPDPAPLPDALPESDDVVTRGLRHLRAQWADPNAATKCDAFALRYLQKRPVGDVAGMYAVSARTINNWLNAVKDALDAWRKEEQA